MSVLIRGMEMPTSCMLCNFCVGEADPANGEMCMVTGTLMPPCTRERLDNCPLVSVPPHGDLVDKQRMAETNEQHYKIFEGEPDADYARKVVLRMLDQAPIVIPAEEGE